VPGGGGDAILQSVCKVSKGCLSYLIDKGSPYTLKLFSIGLTLIFKQFIASMISKTRQLKSDFPFPLPPYFPPSTATFVGS
jgi:hypothetical protein